MAGCCGLLVEGSSVEVESDWKESSSPLSDPEDECKGRFFLSASTEANTKIKLIEIRNLMFIYK